MIQSLSLCAEVTLGLHNLNSEGTEGNQQQTRVVHVIDPLGKRHAVNAISGDMFKHIFVQHLTDALRMLGQPLSTGAAAGAADRVTVDAAFKTAARGKTAAEIQSEMLLRCAVTDIAGTLFTEGTTMPRKSCVEFRWVTGIPEKVHSEQYFHVKFEADRKMATRGEGTIAGSQTVFHRPANSGVYALICHLELARIGMNDVTREQVIPGDDLVIRQRATIQALLTTLMRPAGAQRNTQSPHIQGCSGAITSSNSYLPAPIFSPLASGYRAELVSIVETLNRMQPGKVAIQQFDSLAEGLSLLERAAAEIA